LYDYQTEKQGLASGEQALVRLKSKDANCFGARKASDIHQEQPHQTPWSHTEHKKDVFARLRLWEKESKHGHQEKADTPHECENEEQKPGDDCE
jgi:hypothetical protein